MKFNSQSKLVGAVITFVMTLAISSSAYSYTAGVRTAIKESAEILGSIGKMAEMAKLRGGSLAVRSSYFDTAMAKMPQTLKEQVLARIKMAEKASVNDIKVLAEIFALDGDEFAIGNSEVAQLVAGTSNVTSIQSVAYTKFTTLAPGVRTQQEDLKAEILDSAKDKGYTDGEIANIMGSIKGAQSYVNRLIKGGSSLTSFFGPKSKECILKWTKAPVLNFFKIASVVKTATTQQAALSLMAAKSVSMQLASNKPAGMKKVCKLARECDLINPAAISGCK